MATSGTTTEKTSVAPSTPVAAPKKPPTPVEVTLDEFCVRLSNTDKRVALISGFHYTEKVAGHLKDFEPNYKARYATFITQPVKKPAKQPTPKKPANLSARRSARK